MGQDAVLAKNHQALKAIADVGHEIGNHSFHHEPWLHLYSNEEISQELTLAEEHIENQAKISATFSLCHSHLSP